MYSSSRNDDDAEEQGIDMSLQDRSYGTLTYEESLKDISLSQQRLGTFFGVYIPTVVGSLGGVVLLRLSWAVGQAGTFFVVAVSAMY